MAAMRITRKAVNRLCAWLERNSQQRQSKAQRRQSKPKTSDPPLAKPELNCDGFSNRIACLSDRPLFKCVKQREAPQTKTALLLLVVLSFKQVK